MKRVAIIIASSAISIFMILSCSEEGFVGKKTNNKLPEVWLSSGPVEGDTTSYKVHFYWGGWDPDGEIDHFEFVIVDGNPFGFKEADTTGHDKWHCTTSYDSVINVSADRYVADTTFGKRKYSYYDRTHTFFIRAVDRFGACSVPAYRSFTAWTIAPYVDINKPQRGNTVDQVLNVVVTFGWEGRDPIDGTFNVQEPESVRYLYTPIIDTTGAYNYAFNIVKDLNENPMRYEDLWSKWVYYRAPNDSGRETTLGDDEVLELNKSYIFAVQAKDEAGAVTSIFDYGSNVRRFITSINHPTLKISEPYLGTHIFVGLTMKPVLFKFASGVPLNFSWQGDASSYAGAISGYSYGWDVGDLGNPDDWIVYRNPYVKTAPEKRFYSGVHTFFVEAVDNSGMATIGQIEITIVPLSMNRNLLWIDDYYSTDFTQKLWATPTESQHDQFWLSLCSKAADFEPEQDVYDCDEHNLRMPDITLISRYKNIIWTYSSDKDVTVWPDMIKFTPESMVEQGTKISLNLLSIFINKGGHLLTLGDSRGTSGLVAAVPVSIAFPMNLKCEMTGNRQGCDVDTSGVNSMPYRDYCVSVIDKVSGVFRRDEGMPRRYMKLDVMKYAYLDRNDTINKMTMGMPDRLLLSEDVTKTGRFYDPNSSWGPGGLDLVEVYDPEYWMDAAYINSQSCFHPMYRMKTRSTLSPIDDAAAAIWVTKYDDVVPDGISGVNVAAPSAHFGFPLWYFKKSTVDSIIDVIFDKWGILKE